jgi:flagellar basal-body rod protein FlgG
MMVGTGVKILSTEKIYAQGNMSNTNNPLDLAISGNGFFQIQQPDGTIAYTRDGTFTVSNTGQVVNSSGMPLIPNITIPNNAASVTVGIDGTVSIELVAGGGSQNLGNIQIANFINPSGLTPIGNNMIIATSASGPPQLLQPGTNGAGTLLQGNLETSNVNVVEEMVNMIETQRAYEMNSKAIEAVDGMLKYINTNL